MGYSYVYPPLKSGGGGDDHGGSTFREVGFHQSESFGHDGAFGPGLTKIENDTIDSMSNKELFLPEDGHLGHGGFGHDEGNFEMDAPPHTQARPDFLPSRHQGGQPTGHDGEDVGFNVSHHPFRG
jgi:hypothetical protein